MITLRPQRVQEEGIFFTTETTTGMKSVREVEEFFIHPNRIKQIESELKKTRQSYRYKSSPGLTLKLGEAAQNDKT